MGGAPDRSHSNLSVRDSAGPLGVNCVFTATMHHIQGRGWEPSHPADRQTHTHTHTRRSLAALLRARRPQWAPLLAPDTTVKLPQVTRLPPPQTRSGPGGVRADRPSSAPLQHTRGARGSLCATLVLAFRMDYPPRWFRWLCLPPTPPPAGEVSGVAAVCHQPHASWAPRRPCWGTVAPTACS